MESVAEIARSFKTESRECVKCHKAFDAIVLNAFVSDLCPSCDVVEVSVVSDITTSQAQILSTWKSFCKDRSLYADTSEDRLRRDMTAKGHAEQFKQIITWQLNPIGLFITGASGLCKTRSVFALLRRLNTQHKGTLNLIMLSGAGFGRQCADAFFNGTSDEFIWKLSRASVLFLDDVGNDKMTERVGVSLFEVLENRSADRKPTIITSNYTHTSLEKRFEQIETGKAFGRRVEDFLDAVIL